jgi:TetR/AcrR family transcriptional regulator
MPNTAEASNRDSRAVLLAASAEEFATHGLQGARIQAIVKRASVNERMIYHHFGSKDGLYAAVIEAQWIALARAWQPALVDASDRAPADGLSHAFVALAQALFERPLLMRLALHEAMTGWQFAPAAALDRLPPQLRALHRRGVRDGQFRGDVEFETVYLTILGALIGHSILARRFSDVRARARDARAAQAASVQVVQLVLDGVARRPARSRAARQERAAS